MGLFPIFNLLCNHPKGVTCEIPRTLLVLSSSLAKATALQLLGSSPLSRRLPVVKSSLRSVLQCARNNSGATGCFIDKSWVLDRRLHLSKLAKPVPVLNVDGTRNQEGDITHYVLLTVGVGKHAERLWCAVTRAQRGYG